MRRLCVRWGLFLPVLLALPVWAQERVLFDQKVKIPYALEHESAASVVKPGEYFLTVKVTGAAEPFLTLSTGKKDLLRVRGEYVTPPADVRNLKLQVDQGRLRIERLADEETPERKWLVFHLDYKIFGDEYRRLTFRVREARPTAK